MTLRIQKSSERERIVLRLSGRIQTEQIRELRTLLQAEASDNHIVLDLADVQLVDRDAVRFLAQAEAEGAGLRNCSAFIREWISQERNEMQRTEAEAQQF